jgi:pimeloyl-ACP methyl ester carboxylesterase
MRKIMVQTRRLTVLVSALLVGAATIVWPTMYGSAAAASTTEAPVPDLHWSACPPAQPGNPSLAGFQCATMAVPLDYSDPSGRKIDLGLVKHPAAIPSRRIGTVFFNPGGPSDQGSVYLPGLFGGFPAEVVNRFDIVSWDPRGMGGMSSPVVQCFPNLAAEQAFLAPAGFPPLTPSQQITWTDIHTRFNQHCAGHDDALLAHVSTADNARDLDLMRQAVGEAKLYYYGTSYGTYLGATYANMFPAHVQATVLDGTINPEAWSQAEGDLGTFIRIGSDLATAATLKAFLTLCGQATASQCAFSAGSPRATARKYTALLGKAAKSPIVLDGEKFTENDIVALTGPSLYIVHPIAGFSHFIGWNGLAALLQMLWTSKGPATPPAASGTTPGAAMAADAAATQTYSGAERQTSIICSESPNPVTARASINQADFSLARAGVTSQIWPWIAYCAGWPVKAASAYLGPWNHRTKPIVVVGTTGDPATPYDNAVQAANILPGARLITVKGYGHTELANPSTCAQNLIAAYLVNGVLPSRGATCAQNVPPLR